MSRYAFPPATKTLVGGVPLWAITKVVKPELSRMGFKPQYTIETRLEDAARFLAQGQEYDLMILGWQGQAIYEQAAAMAQKNPGIPSLLLVPPADLNYWQHYNRVHPPHATCRFGDLKVMEKGTLDHILSGNYHQFG